MLKIFLDTEFTDFVDPQLISLGMVAETGEEFYAEVPYQNEACSEFVRETVVPLLGRIANAHCSLEDLRFQILNWLGIVRRNGEPVEICIDYQTDWNLFCKALDYRVPTWCMKRLIAQNINDLLLYEFHKISSLAEHHALYDARANQYAFREIPSNSVNQTEPPDLL